MSQDNIPAPEREANPFHRVGALSFGDDGSDQLQVECEFSSYGPFAGQWLVGIAIWEHPDLVDHYNPVQWDAENDEQIPEARWAMAPKQARRLAELVVKAVEAAELFQDGLNDAGPICP